MYDTWLFDQSMIIVEKILITIFLFDIINDLHRFSF